MEKLLKKYFGYDKFRSNQKDIIHNVISGKDTLVLMPTGGGKSISFQIPALHLNGVTIVISPLISLMKDQVESLKLNKIPAEYLSSTMSQIDQDEILFRTINNEVKLLYISPERLATKSFRDFLKKINLSLITIDEAHCISEWGHDFREDYRKLKSLKSDFPLIPIIALTATATTKVKNDILKQLNLDEPKVFQTSFNRENLNIQVRDKKNSLAKILALVEKNKNESIIIYCHSRKDCENLSDELNKYGFKSIVYHAGLSSKKRDLNQELFINDKVNIIVATIAFGMGIDKSNVRLVIHNTFSKSIEGYYQEIGRAGRDGLESNCVLFYSKEDKRKHEFFINYSNSSNSRKESNIKLQDMISFCETSKCRKKFILEYFGENFNIENCGSCDICLNLEDKKDSIQNSIKSFDNDLFNELKNIRFELANLNKVQPEHIFNDVILKQMATNFPKDENDLLNISGVTKEKVISFGDDFLIHINEYIDLLELTKNKSHIYIPQDEENDQKFNFVKKKKKKTFRKKKYKK